MYRGYFFHVHLISRTTLPVWQMDSSFILEGYKIIFQDAFIHSIVLSYQIRSRNNQIAKAMQNNRYRNIQNADQGNVCL